jgi:Uma2 family endonuclease
MTSATLDRPRGLSYASGHVVFPDSDWSFYQQVQKRLGEQPTRVNFSDGVLEITTLSLEHERYKTAMHHVVMGLCMAFDVPAVSAGSTTLKHKLKAQALEPDQCYYVTNAAGLKCKKRIDLEKDPPPDFVIEIDVTHKAVDREGIYHSFGVPELWTYDGVSSACFRRTFKGWRQVDRSTWFPEVRVADLAQFKPHFDEADVKLMQRVAKWAMASK